MEDKATTTSTKHTKITIVIIAAAIIALAIAGITIAIIAANNPNEDINVDDGTSIIADANKSDNSSMQTETSTTSRLTETVTEVPTTGPASLLPLALVSGAITTAATYLYLAKK